MFKSIFFTLLLLGCSWSVYAAIDEQSFEAVAQRFERAMQPHARALGGELYVLTEWGNNGVNAFVHQSDTKRLSRPPFGGVGPGGKYWEIGIQGGVARQPLVDEEVMELLLCHELGHHMGGYPYKTEFLTGEKRWISTEGQADYFATGHCLSLLWRNRPSTYIANYSEQAQALCRDHGGYFSRKLCARVIDASWRFTLFNADVVNEKKPLIGAIAPEVESLLEKHSPSQCRLNTFIAGALCQSFPCKEGIGARPHCWYVKEYENTH